MSLLLAILLVSGGTSSPASEVDAELRAVVREANQAWIRAARSLDAHELAPLFVDRALREHDEALQIARDDGFYVQSTLVDLEFLSVELDASRGVARVTTSESWRSVHRRVGTGKCLGRSTRRGHRQVYGLRKDPEGWRVVSVDSPEDNPKAVREPC